MEVQATNLGVSDGGLLATFRTVTGESPLPTAVVQGPCHTILYVNQAFSRFVQREEEQLVGFPWDQVAYTGRHFSSHLTRAYDSGEHRLQGVVDAEYAPYTEFAVWPIHGSSGAAPELSALVIQFQESSLMKRHAGETRQAEVLQAARHEQENQRLNDQLRFEEGERNKVFEALMQSEKLASLGRMAASIAHEINNPLEAVTNTIYLAKIQPGLPEHARIYLDMTDAELNRIAHITRQTLGFYRESHGETTFSAVSLLESVTHLLQPKIRSSNVAVDCRIDEAVLITAHFGELRQVFSNLVSNSLDALETGGRLCLRANLRLNLAKEEASIRLTISDDGCGIERAALKQIFEPFFTTKGSTGNGLGLWVSREIVKKHGGKILVRSSTSGARKGTTFSVVLPQAQAKVAA